MKISLDWLSEYVKTDRSVEEISQILSDLGFPTEGIEYPDGDTVIDLEITSNRGDCLSYIGIARELAAVTGSELKLPVIKLKESQKEVSEFADVEIADSDFCGRYTARVICGVKVGPSPEWMKKRLEAVGIRSVNNVVDATNYAMMETGQPPHAFDYEKLSGSKIIVRKGIKGEQLVSIDETKCELDKDMLIISDEKKPVAIAGVMGGLDTEISETTTTILLEDAHFDPVSVRTTGRRLGIKSESLFRFERQVDIERIDWASQRTAQLITEAAGGAVVRGVADEYPRKHEAKTVKMRFWRLNKLLGIEVSQDEVMGIFSGLGFGPAAGDEDTVICTVPSWRHDIYREVDLIEEATRSHGYDNIPVEEKINIEVVPVDRREKTAGELRAYLNGCGFYETINVTFVDGQIAGLFGDGDPAGHIGVKDDSRRSANLLRQTLIGSLLGVFKSNYNAGNIPCRIFELADTFKPAKDANAELPEERTKLGFIRAGDLRELRGVIEGLISIINRELRTELKVVELAWAKAGAEIFVGDTLVGICGVVSEKVVEKFDLAEITVCAAELDIETLMGMQDSSLTVSGIPRFPSITRDLSLIVDEGVLWAEIIEAVKRKAPGELEDVGFAGIYRGNPIPSGKKSVTISLRFRDERGTLRNEAVDGFESDILGELKVKLGAELRTI